MPPSQIPAPTLQRRQSTGACSVDDVSDALDFDAPPPPVALTNTGDYQLFGTEAFLFLTPAQDLDLFIGGAYQNPSSSDVPNYPESSLSAGANLRLSEKWSLNTDAQYVDSQYTQGTRFNPGTQQVGSYFIVNARIAYAIDLQLPAAAENFPKKRLLALPQSLLSALSFLNQGTLMARICAITGKRPVKGGRIIRKGLTKKSGGIGTSLVKNTRRKFRPNVQRIRVKLPSGQVKRLWVSVKAIKAGKVTKA